MSEPPQSSGSPQWKPYQAGSDQAGSDQAGSGNGDESLPPTHSTGSGERPINSPSPYGPPADSDALATLGATMTAVRSRAKVGVMIAVLVAVLGVGIGVFAAVRGSDTTSGLGGVFDGGTSNETAKPQVLTTDGFADLVAALKNDRQSTEVFSVVLYPEYAVLDVPVDHSSHRKESAYYDGSLRDWGSKGTTDGARFDLASIDPQAFLDALPAAKALVEDPTSWYVIIEKPSTPGDGWFSVYASNEYSEGGYLSLTRNGKEVARHSWPEEPTDE